MEHHKSYQKVVMMMMVVLCLQAAIVSAQTQKTATSQLLVSFPSGSKMLLGYLYRPNGDGPFPAVVFHHGLKGSLLKEEISNWEKMGNFFTRHGYILFLPDRHTETVDPSEFSPGLQQQIHAHRDDPAVKQQQTIEKTEMIGRDIAAALAWLKQQPDINTNRIAVAGHLAGAVQTLYAGDTSDVRALIAFSPALQKWDAEPVIRGLLVSAVRKAKPPISLIYVENNPTLAPAETLGNELSQKGKPNRSRIYPAFGKPKDQGKTFVPDAVDIWGPDIVAFLKETMR